MQPFRFKQIDNPGGEWVVRSDNGEINPVFFGKPRELRQVVCGERNVLANFLGTGISGRAKNTMGRGRLCQFPHQGVLATSAADDENFHRGERASAANEKQVRQESREGLCGPACGSAERRPTTEAFASAHW